MSEPFVALTGVAAPVMRANIDTDVIIRVERMTGTTPRSMGEWAFESLRFRPDGSEDPAFVLNRAPFREAPILLAGPNFGCGSSREAAVWALKHRGIRSVVAPSFGDIFYNNCFPNGLLPVVLPAESVERIAAGSEGGNARVTVDLERQIVTGPDGQEYPFPIEPMRREALLKGLDDIGLTLQHAAAIDAFRARDEAERPWIWQPGGGESRASLSPRQRGEVEQPAERAPG